MLIDPHSWLLLLLSAQLTCYLVDLLSIYMAGEQPATSDSSRSCRVMPTRDQLRQCSHSAAVGSLDGQSQRCEQ